MAGGVDYWVVFVQGLAVSGHCVGMCGGFVMAYSGAVVLSGQNRAARLALAHLLFNLGRMFTFSTLGFLAGWLGSVADLAAKAQGLQGVVALVAGVLMIFLGLGGLGVFPGFKLEREELVAGSGWFQGAMVRAVRSQSPLKPMVIGSLVGFLPCGALWTILLYAASAGSGPVGMGMLTAYSLGTTPALFGVGMIAAWLGQVGRRRLNVVAALMLIALGGLAIYRGLVGSGWL